MTRLKLADLSDEKPVRISVEFPARVHRSLLAYAAALNQGEPRGAPAVERIIPVMVDRFIQGDRAFSRSRRTDQTGADV